MLQHLIVILLGAFSNRYRGGIFGKDREAFIHGIFGTGKIGWFANQMADGKKVNAVIWAFFCTVLFASVYEGNGYYVFAAGASIIFVYSLIMMIRYSAPGWGDYIGAAGGWRSDTAEKPLAEVEYIDELIKGVKHKPVLWGMAGLSIRCGEWGLFLGAPLITFLNYWAFGPMVMGLLAGPVVAALGKLDRKGWLPKIKYLMSPWEWFEALLGVGFFYIVFLGAKANGL